MATITPRKDASGKISAYLIRVYRGYDNSGKRLKPYTTTWNPPPGMSEKRAEKEVQRQAALFEEACRNGLTGTAEKMKLCEFAPQYLEAMKTKLSPVDYGGYVKTVENLILPALGHIRLSELRPVHVQEFVKMLSTMPKQNRSGKPCEDGSRLAVSTIKRKLAVLQSMLSFAVKLGYIAANPASAERLTLPKAAPPAVEIFTKQEAAHIIQCLECEPLQFQALIQLAIFTGAREGELVGLRFSDIDFFNHKVTIARSAYKLSGEPIKTKPPKSGKPRTVAVSASCVKLLEKLYKQHKEEAKQLGSQWENGGWVFTQWNGHIMHPQTPAKQFEKFLKRHGIPHRKFHSLRHTSATLLLYNGTDLKTVQERLGHADFTTTNKYLHLVEQADVEAANGLEILLKAKRA